MEKTIIFKQGVKIKNTKTGKVGYVVSFEEIYDLKLLKYHLEGTPNNVHTESRPFERFKILEEI